MKDWQAPNGVDCNALAPQPRRLPVGQFALETGPSAIFSQGVGDPDTAGPEANTKGRTTNAAIIGLFLLIIIPAVDEINSV